MAKSHIDVKISFDEIIEMVCAHIPEGWSIDLMMEHGAATVKCVDPERRGRELPDLTDKTIIEQLNDALCVAKGFDPFDR